jgi:hypothetical protein
MPVFGNEGWHIFLGSYLGGVTFVQDLQYGTYHFNQG